MSTNYAVFDIETSPLPEAELEAMIPEFDPDEVKIGNRKPETAAPYIEQKRLEHRQRFIDRAALSPLTGSVCAIGALNSVNTNPLVFLGQEQSILGRFFEYFDKMQPWTAWVGFNIAEFDCPFLTRRAWKLGITPPTFFRHRYLEDNVIDLMQVWRCGMRNDDVSLDRLARFLGVGEKKVSGADFHKLLVTDPEAARAYLCHDLALTRDIAVKMGIIERGS